METLGTPGEAWLVVLDLLKIVSCFTPRYGQVGTGMEASDDSLQGAAVQLGLERGGCGPGQLCPSASGEEQVLNLWMPGFPSGLIPE